MIPMYIVINIHRVESKLQTAIDRIPFMMQINLQMWIPATPSLSLVACATPIVSTN